MTKNQGLLLGITFMLLFTGVALATSTTVSASSNVIIYAFDQNPAGRDEGNQWVTLIQSHELDSLSIALRVLNSLIRSSSQLSALNPGTALQCPYIQASQNIRLNMTADRTWQTLLNSHFCCDRYMYPLHEKKTSIFIRVRNNRYYLTIFINKNIQVIISKLSSYSLRFSHSSLFRVEEGEG